MRLDGKKEMVVKGSEAEARMHKGRPTRLEKDPELIKKIRNAILLGAPVMTAAAINDVPYDTFREWIVHGRENPDSNYGELLKIVCKAVAEWEIRDLAAWDAHVTGRPAQYLKQQMINAKGEPIFDSEGKPVMEYVRDADGNLILEASEIKPDWRAAAERMARRKPKVWGQRLGIDLDAVLTFDNNDKINHEREALSFEQRIAKAVKELEEEV